jgi:hypothetical protein
MPIVSLFGPDGSGKSSLAVGGVTELVKETPAENMLFEPNNEDALLDRIEKVLSMSKEQLTDIGIGLRTSVLHKFRDDKIKSQLFNSLLGDTLT